MPMADGDAKEVIARLQPVLGMIDSVREALRSPKGLMGKPTWYGPKAEQWGTDWDARRADIEGFLSSAEEECRRMIRIAQGRHG
jgi:hypothetical protein